jgi:hypothetical protein
MPEHQHSWGKHQQKAAAAPGPNWLVPEHQHSWANINKKLLLLLDPTGLCSSTSTVGKHVHKAAAASRPNWLMQQHQHSSANMNKKLLLLKKTAKKQRQHQLGCMCTHLR